MAASVDASSGLIEFFGQARLPYAQRGDTTVVLLAGPGDRILTSDPGGITRLAAAAGNRAVVIAC